MKRYIVASIALACVWQSPGVCQSKQADNAPLGANSVTVFQGAKIIDGTGSPAIENGSITVRGDKIESISAKPLAHIPAGARLFDARGTTIMPTLMLGHAHLGLMEGARNDGSHQTEAKDIKQLKRYLQYGVGAVMSLGTDQDMIYPLRNKRNERLIDGPYILTAGHGLGVPDGAPPPATGIDKPYRPQTAEEARRDVDELATHHPDIVKIWVDDLHGKAPTMKPEIYKAIIAEAHRHGLRVAAHVWYLADAKAVIAAGVDVLAHSIRDQPVDNELISAMKSHGVFYIPTLAVDESFFIYKENPDWMNSKFFNDALEPGVSDYLKSDKYMPQEIERNAEKIAQNNLKTLYDAGVKVGFGTDSGTPERPQGFTEHRELQLMVAAGLTPMQAIQCATGNSAAMLGLSKRMGTLAPGKLANLIVLEADPLSNISNTEKIICVWIDGHEQWRK